MPPDHIGQIIRQTAAESRENGFNGRLFIDAIARPAVTFVQMLTIVDNINWVPNSFVCNPFGQNWRLEDRAPIQSSSHSSVIGRSHTWWAQCAMSIHQDFFYSSEKIFLCHLILYHHFMMFGLPMVNKSCKIINTLAVVTKYHWTRFN